MKFQSAMDIPKPFKSTFFMSWVKEMRSQGYNLSTSLARGTSFAHFGDAEVGQKVTSQVLNEKKRKNCDWKGDPAKFKKLNIPLSEMKQKDIKKEVPHVLQFFNGGSSKYGVGHLSFGIIM